MSDSQDRGVDALQRLHRVRAAARALSAVVRTATTSTAQYEGRDATRLVSLTARADGAVVHVWIDERWFRGRAMAALGPALMEAYHNAMTDVMAAGSALIEEAEQRAAIAESESDTAGGPLSSAPSATVDGYRRVTFADVADALRARDELLARDPRTGQPAETVHGPSGFVTIVTRGGDIAEITVDPSAPRDRADELARDAEGAFAQLGARHADQF